MAKRILVVAVMLLLISGAASAQTFSDVPQNHWAHDAVEKAARLGLVVGRGDGTFRGDKPPTRYEMAMGMSKILAEVENRMKAQPVFTREVLTLLEGLNRNLAAKIDETRLGQRYLMYLVEQTYVNEFRKALPDFRNQFADKVERRMADQFPTKAGSSTD
jgi:hypothetical protein